jgi:hypothetical protein
MKLRRDGSNEEECAMGFVGHSRTFWCDPSRAKGGPAITDALLYCRLSGARDCFAVILDSTNKIAHETAVNRAGFYAMFVFVCPR